MTRITDAVRTANRIMRKYDERDPERIAHYAGIMILPQPFVKQKGAYTVMMRKPIIFIKRDLHPAMRSIVLAHELGHHFLHRQEAIQSGGFHEFNLFDMQNNQMEYEANVFAAQLKLPDEDVLECVYNGYDIAATARALHSDINLVALKIAELNRRGYQLREQEYRNKFLRS